MATNYDSVDLDWSWDGDLLVDEAGDLKDTSDDHLRSLLNEIQTIVKSNAGDWRDNKEVGADIDDFVGEPNDRYTGEALRNRITASLQLILRGTDVSVRILPVHIHKVLIIVNVQATATNKNKLRSFDPIVVNFIFDYQENGLYIAGSSMNHYLQTRDDL